MTVTGQNIVGDIVVDDYSSLTLYLKSSSSFKGTINSAESSGTINIVIDSTSTLTLTGDSKISKLTNDDSTGSNVITGDYTLSYSDDDDDDSGSSGKANYVKTCVLSLILIIMIL